MRPARHKQARSTQRSTDPLPDREERRRLTVREPHLRPLNPTRRFASRANSCQHFNFFAAQRQFDRLPPCCHFATNEESRGRTLQWGWTEGAALFSQDHRPTEANWQQEEPVDEAKPFDIPNGKSGKPSRR
jgi:hypothetical protein